MYIRNLAASLARRWYLCVAVIAVCVGMCALALQSIQPTYQQSASVVLVPPETSLDEGGNPYLYLGGLQQSVDVLTRAVTSDSARSEVAKSAPTGTYEVIADYQTSAPILIVTADDATSAGTARLLDAVLAQVPASLRQLQLTLGIRPASRITSMVLSEDDAPEAIQKARYRTVAVVGAGTLFFGVLLVGAVDGLLLRRRSRRRDENERIEGSESVSTGQGDDVLSGEFYEALRQFRSADHPIEPAAPSRRDL